MLYGVRTFQALSSISDDLSLQAHVWVSCVAEILHRDISINNVMIRRNADGSVDGVLCDWDLSLDLKFAKSSSYSAPDIVGTPPFMSIDRLLAISPETRPSTLDNHRQEHDLESFFYLLVLFVATRNENQPELINEWFDDSYLVVAEAKRDFLLDDNVFWNFLPLGLPDDYERFLLPKGLITTLRETWRKAYVRYRGVGMKAYRRVKSGELLNDILGAYPWN